MARRKPQKAPTPAPDTPERRPAFESLRGLVASLAVAVFVAGTGGDPADAKRVVLTAVDRLLDRVLTSDSASVKSPSVVVNDHPRKAAPTSDAGPFLLPPVVSDAARMKSPKESEWQHPVPRVDSPLARHR